MPNTGDGGTGTGKAPAPPSRTVTLIRGGQEPGTATASSAHDMLIALFILSVFVYGLVLVAGESQRAGQIVVTFFVALILLQGLGHVDPFLEWVDKHPLQPQRTSS